MDFPCSNASKRCRRNGKQCRPRSANCSSRSSLIRIYTVCSDLSVRKFRNITVDEFSHFSFSCFHFAIQFSVVLLFLWTTAISPASSLGGGRGLQTVGTFSTMSFQISCWVLLNAVVHTLCLLLPQRIPVKHSMSHIVTKSTNAMCAQGRLRSALASAHSDQSLRCPHEESLGP